jgi:hypothetical protein
VWHAPAVLAGVFVLTLAAALPFAIAMRGLLEAHVGRSLVAGDLAGGVNYDWWQEFAAQATGLGRTFTPAVIGFASTLDGIGSVMDAQGKAMPVTAALAMYLAAWTFMSGGILDRYARQRRTRAHGFFAACGVYFWRFLRLALVAGAVYWVLFTSVHGWLFDDLYDRVTRDVAVERVAFAWRAALYALFGIALVLVNIVVDFAKIRLVVEDRLSVVGALSASLGFLGRHPGRAFGLYAVNALVFVLLLAVWAVAAPGAGGAGLSMWIVVLATQLYLVARLILKLQFLASETALFQRSLAHASYTAAPTPVWPESPAAETIGR